MTGPIKVMVPVIRDPKNSTRYRYGRITLKKDSVFDTEAKELTTAVLREILPKIIALGGYGQIVVEYLPTGSCCLNLYNYDISTFSASRAKRFKREVDKLESSTIREKNNPSSQPKRRLTMTLVVG